MSSGPFDPVTIPATAWERSETQALLRDRDIAGLFRLAQQYAGASQTRLAAATGIAQGRISEIMSGRKRVTQLDVFERIADGLAMPDDARMVLGLAPGIKRPAPGDALVLGLEFADELQTAESMLGDLLAADLERTDSLTAAAPDASAWDAASARWLFARSDGDLSGQGGRVVSLTDVKMVSFTADTFNTLDGKFGGGHARTALVQYLHSEVRELLNASYTEAIGKRLYSSVAEALLLTAWMSYDSGLHGIAQRYFIQALRMSHAANDRLLGGSILSAMSHQATFVGRYTDAARLARAALSGPAAGITPTLAAQFNAMEARALARMGDTHGCERALAEAERQLSRRTPDSDPPYIAYFDEVELAAEFAHCFRDLNRPQLATERGPASIFNDGHNDRSDFFATMVQAEAYVEQGEIGQGFNTALRALHQGEGLKSARCVQYVHEFRQRITDGMQRTPDFQDFAEQARGFRLWRQAESRT